MTISRKRVFGLIMVLLACTILSCVLYCGWRMLIKRTDVIGVYILDRPPLEGTRTYGIHTLTLMDNGRYEYRWKGTPEEDESVHTGTWTFKRWLEGAHVTLHQFQLEPHRDPDKEGRSYYCILPVVRSSKGVPQLFVHDYEEWNFNKQTAGVK